MESLRSVFVLQLDGRPFVPVRDRLYRCDRLAYRVDLLCRLSRFRYLVPTDRGRLRGILPVFFRQKPFFDVGKRVLRPDRLRVDIRTAVIAANEPAH